MKVLCAIMVLLGVLTLGRIIIECRRSSKSIKYSAISCRKHTALLTDYGAMGDGKTSNTKAFKVAIDDLSKFAWDGGALLIAPPGKWVTGAFILTSNVTLYIQKDATILASKDESEYPLLAFLPSMGKTNKHLVMVLDTKASFFGTNPTDVVIIDIWMNGNYKLHTDDGYDPKTLPIIENINYKNMTAHNMTMGAALAGIENDPYTGICISNVDINLSSKPKKLQ